MARAAGATLLLVALVVNVLAYRHAQAFTRFGEGGERTRKPEELSWPERLAVLVTGPTLPRPRNGRTPGDVGLTFETVRFPAGDGLDLEGWWLPAPAARGSVALFHGYADSKASLLGEAAAFRELGLQVLLVDMRGSGGSEGHETTLGYREAHDVAGAAEYARARNPSGLQIAFGASMGAAAIVRASAEGWADLDALILQAPFDRMRSALGHRFDALSVPAFPAADLLLLWGGWLRGFDANAWNPIDLAPRVRAPVLLLHGTADARVPLGEGRLMAERFGGPAHLHAFPGAGHESLASASPAEWRTAVAAFLDGLGQLRAPTGGSPATSN